MPWLNRSPSHIRRVRDAEQMRRAWESWWYGRTGQRVVWEEGTRGHIREVYLDRHHKSPAHCAIIVFHPAGVWYDTHHEWDHYTFACLLQLQPQGQFEEVQKTGKWLREYTWAHALATDLEQQSQTYLQTASHPLCQQHRREKQNAFLLWQHSLPAERKWTQERVQQQLQRLAGPDEPVSTNYHLTATGETFDERKAYHDKGELSPGEHALAQAIRERLQKHTTEG